MAQKLPIPDLSESFLHFLDDEKFNKNRDTYCEEKSANAYHDSSYRWCKSCNKLYCTRCSLVHLLNNQITHTPIDKVFLSKEHLDVEYMRDSNKLNELKQSIDNYFNNNKKGISEEQYLLLNETLQKFKEFAKELFNILDNYQKKIKNEIENIEKNSKNLSGNNLSENYVKSNFSDIKNRFLNIEKKYNKNKNFHPTQMKSYHDELSEAYKEFSKLNDLMKNNNNNKNNCVEEINVEIGKVKNKLNNAINLLKDYSSNVKKLMNEGKI